MSQGASQSIATFRDPAGSLRIHGEDVLRTVHPRYAAESLRFLQSDLASRWIEEGHLVASEVLSAEEDQPLLLQHPRDLFPIVSLGMDSLAMGSSRRTNARTMRPAAS